MTDHLDLEAIRRECGARVSCGLDHDCTCLGDDYREVMLRLVEEVERFRAHLAADCQDDLWKVAANEWADQRTQLIAERDFWVNLAQKDLEPCPLDHGCDDDEPCNCWCTLHGCAISECPTFREVELWVQHLYKEGRWLAEKARKTERDAAVTRIERLQRALGRCEKHSLEDERDMLRIAAERDQLVKTVAQHKPIVEAAQAIVADWKANRATHGRDLIAAVESAAGESPDV